MGDLACLAHARYLLRPCLPALVRPSCRRHNICMRMMGSADVLDGIDREGSAGSATLRHHGKRALHGIASLMAY